MYTAVSVGTRVGILGKCSPETVVISMRAIPSGGVKPGIRASLMIHTPTPISRSVGWMSDITCTNSKTNTNTNDQNVF